jgi:hypothetical protein
MSDPIACGMAMRFQSAGLGKRMRAVSCVAFSQSGAVVCTSISLIAKRPTITRIGGIPASSSGLPKVKRFSPVTGSVPIVATISPITPAMSPFSSESPASEAMTLRPRIPSAKYEGGVNARATLERRSVSSTSTKSPNRPPTNPEYNEMPSASPAFPCRFI